MTNLIEIQQALLVMSELTFNSAVEAFNAGSYSNASKAFRRSYNLAESFGSIDTTTLYNAGLAAELAREFGPAEEIYTQLIEDGIRSALYILLNDINFDG
jgi:hypothetical protein